MSEYDPTSSIMGTVDMMGGNLSQLGSDVLEKRQTDKANAWNLEMWNLQNQYNDPSAQMARLKAAGLNPNLMYGKGTPGIAPSPQGAIKSNASGKPEFNMLEAYTRSMEAQIIPYQKDLVIQQLKNQKIQEEILGADLNKKKFWNQIYDYSDPANVGAVYLRDVIGPAQKREFEALNEKEKTDILKNQQEIQNLQKELLTGQIDMNKYEIELNKLGLTKHDAVVYRIFKNLMEKLGLEVQ